MIGFVLDLLSWPVRAGADRVIAALEAVQDEILTMWDDWDAQEMAHPIVTVAA